MSGLIESRLDGSPCRRCRTSKRWFLLCGWSRHFDDTNARTVIFAGLAGPVWVGESMIAVGGWARKVGCGCPWLSAVVRQSADTPAAGGGVEGNRAWSLSILWAGSPGTVSRNRRLRRLGCVGAHRAWSCRAKAHAGCGGHDCRRLVKAMGVGFRYGRRTGQGLGTVARSRTTVQSWGAG
jgi:hypothetical protein